MDPKIAEPVGLQRHQIISPVLMESGRGQAKYFRETASREWDVPGRGMRRFSPMTMKGWLKPRLAGKAKLRLHLRKARQSRSRKVQLLNRRVSAGVAPGLRPQSPLSKFLFNSLH